MFSQHANTHVSERGDRDVGQDFTRHEEGFKYNFHGQGLGEVSRCPWWFVEKIFNLRIISISPKIELGKRFICKNLF